MYFSICAAAEAGWPKNRLRKGVSIWLPARCSRQDIDTSTTQTTLQTPKLVRIPIGIDGLAIIVHDSNKLRSVTMQELKELFGGRVFNWEDVGGTGGEVVLISREDGSGARHLFDKRVMDEDPVSLTAVVMPTSQDVVAYAAKTPSAVGYVSRAFVIELLEYGEANPKVDIQSTGSGAAIREPAPVHVLSVDGLLPTDENLEAQTYPLIQPLYLISNGEPQGWVRQFVDFVLSPAGQSIVGRHHLPVR